VASQAATVRVEVMLGRFDSTEWVQQLSVSLFYMCEDSEVSVIIRIVDLFIVATTNTLFPHGACGGRSCISLWSETVSSKFHSHLRVLRGPLDWLMIHSQILSNEAVLCRRSDPTRPDRMQATEMSNCKATWGADHYPRDLCSLFTGIALDSW
jgi:hypothetical protein